MNDLDSTLELTFDERNVNNQSKDDYDIENELINDNTKDQTGDLTMVGLDKSHSKMSVSKDITLDS